MVSQVLQQSNPLNKPLSSSFTVVDGEKQYLFTKRLYKNQIIIVTSSNLRHLLGTGPQLHGASPLGFTIIHYSQLSLILTWTQYVRRTHGKYIRGQSSYCTRTPRLPFTTFLRRVGIVSPDIVKRRRLTKQCKANCLQYSKSKKIVCYRNITT